MPPLRQKERARTGHGTDVQAPVNSTKADLQDQQIQQRKN